MNIASHSNLPTKTLVKCGTSQLNNKLGKMKSTADLFGNFRGALTKGESI